MEWDEEEEVAPPRSQNKVRHPHRLREVMYRRLAAAATAIQQVNRSDVKTPQHGPSVLFKEMRKVGSVRNARNGIGQRRNYEVCLPPFTFATPLTFYLQLSSLRAYNELMLPSAFAQQRAFLPKKVNAKTRKQETPWPKKLQEKASARSLRSAASFTGLGKLGGSTTSLRQSANSPRTPGQSPALGNLTPPVPAIPTRYAQGSQESFPLPSPFGSANMPALGVDARTRPSSAKKERKTPPGQLNKIEISPFLAYENLAPASSPMTPPLRLTPRLRVPGSTTTLNTLGTSPSREFPSGPEDPFWDEAVARVKATVRRDQEEERRERKATAKAVQKAIRNLSKDRDGRLKWAKLTIEMLAGKYDEHGWLPKKDPKEFNDEDWTFVLEVLNHKDTKALRDRLFKRPEWIEADKARRENYEEEMRTNPTPEYLAALQAKEHKERRDYGFRKILGLLTAEELEAERRKESPLVGLGISSAVEPATPLTTFTAETSETADHSLPSEGTRILKNRGRQVSRPELEESPSRHTGRNHGISSVARHSVEQMTNVFNTESFNPRLSILGSEELKQYIKKNPPIGPSPPTPTPDRSHFNTSLDPRQESGPGSSPGLWLGPKTPPAQRLRVSKKAASSNDLHEEYNRHRVIEPSDAGEFPGLPSLSTHPALRSPDNTPTHPARPAPGSQIPRLRKAVSSTAPLNSSNFPGDIRRQVIAASPPNLGAIPSLQRPPKPRKPSTDVKLPGETPTVNTRGKPTTAVKLQRKSTSPPPSASRLSPVDELQETGIDASPKRAPLIRESSTLVKSPRSTAGSCGQPSSDIQLQPLSYTRHSSFATQPASSPPHVSYSDPLPSTAVVPLTTFVESNGGGERVFELYAPIPLPHNLPPRSLARMSRVPTFPDACDFLAAVEEDEPYGPFELPATPLRSPTPVRSPTPARLPSPLESSPPVRSTIPLDRLNAKSSGIPVATGSNVASNGSESVSVDQSTASFSSSPVDIGSYFLPLPAALQSNQNAGPVSPPLHNVGPYFPSDSVSLQSVSTTGQRREPSPILSVGPYFPPGSVSLELDRNADHQRDAPANFDNVSPISSAEQLTSQLHQTAGAKRNEPAQPSHVPSIPDAAMAKWRDYQETEPLVQYRGDRFEMMVNPSVTQNATTDQVQGESRHHGSHFEIMVDSSSMMYQPSPNKAQERSQHHGNHFGLMLDSSSTMYEPSPERKQRQPRHHGDHFEIMVDSSHNDSSTIAQTQASLARGDADLPATPHVHNPTVVGSHMQEDSPSAQSSRAGKGRLMSRGLRFASSSPRREHQASLSPALPSSKIPSFRSFSENNSPPGARQPAAQDERSISLGSPQSGSPFTRNDRAMTNTGRLAKKFESMKYNVPATDPLRQGRRFESFTPTKIRSPPADGSSTPTSTRSRLRNKLSNVFYADPPAEQQKTSQDQQETRQDRQGTRQVQQEIRQVQQSTSSKTGALDVDFEDVISAWESSSPVPIQSPTPFQSQNQEIQTLRSDIGLEPLCGRIMGEQKHPNHSYCWNTKKVMCRRIHNQGYVLPSLPSPASGQKAYMADRASKYFAGSPYTNESTEAQRCAACKLFCCRFAELSAESEESTKSDVDELDERRRAEETVASLQAKRPNGVEEWDSFLKCSQCNRSYCPSCIRLCKEVLCQQPVCMECIEKTEQCPIHNMF